MPLDEAYQEAIDSPLADMINAILIAQQEALLQLVSYPVLPKNTAGRIWILLELPGFLEKNVMPLADLFLYLLN